MSQEKTTSQLAPLLGDENKKEEFKSDEKAAATQNNGTMYENFTKDHRREWMCFNIFATLISIGLGVGTIVILSAKSEEEDCRGIKFTLYMVLLLHIVNTFEMLLNMTGFEKKLCSGSAVFFFFIFEVTVLVYMQVVYFDS